MSHRQLARGARLWWALVLALLLIAVPAAAQAKFTDGASSAATVGTLTVPAPSLQSGTLSCPSYNRNSGIASASWAPVSRATSYTVVLDPPTGNNVTRTVYGTSTTISAYGTDTTHGTWTLTVRANIGKWFGPAAGGSQPC